MTFRVLALKEGERVKVWSRPGADFANQFATIAEAVRGLVADAAVIDGEGLSSATTDGAISVRS
jgi:ATP-dependent DNA ligase